LPDWPHKPVHVSSILTPATIQRRQIMPNCPFCNEYFLSEGELNNHVHEKHPEKIFSPVEFTKAMMASTELSVIYPVAARLTGISFGGKPTPPAKVLERFTFFLNELTLLMKREGNAKGIP